MRLPHLLISVLSGLLILLPADACLGMELTSRYSVITYDGEEVVRSFNDQLHFGRHLSLFFRKSQELTAAQEAGNKVDQVVEKVKTILEMFPDPLSFKIRLLASAAEVRAVYLQRYRQDCDYIAFYSPAEKTIFISARNAELQVLAHEVAHVIMHHYFKVAPTAKVHEVLAQYVAEHIAD